MGSTSCHLSCIVPTAATQRQIFLYYDVVSHQQPVCQEAWHWEEVTYLQSVLSCWNNMWIWLQVTSTEPLCAAHAAATDDSPTLLKKFSLTRTYRCHLAPLLCGELGGVPGGWADVCGSYQTAGLSKMSGKYVYMARSPSPTARWVFGTRIKVATMRCGCISLMLTLEADRTAQFTTRSGNYT